MHKGTRIQGNSKVQGIKDTHRNKDTRIHKGKRIQGYSVVQWCKGFMGTVVSRAFQIFAWRVTKKYTYSPFNAGSFDIIFLIFFTPNFDKIQ